MMHTPHTLSKRTLLAAALATAALAGMALPSATLAQSQSDKTVKIIVGFPAGGSLDTVARLLAEKMKDELKQNVIVENKPGAGGRLAAELLKNAPADGTTVMMAPFVIPVLAPLMFSKLNYDPKTDFAPIGLVSSFNFGLAVKADLPVKNVAELLAYYKANEAKANFGTPGAGSLPHFFGLLLGRESKTEVVHVPFQGGAPLKLALLGDQLTAGIDTNFEWLADHRAGKLRVLATSGATRSKALPDVPTFREQGFANVVGVGWAAMYAPAKLPADEVTRLNAALNKVLALAQVQDKIHAVGFEVGGGSPSDLTKLMDTDTARWGPVIKASGFKAD
jgi:tripartite-type tricarboxylate transporter receptor subunit TctC